MVVFSTDDNSTDVEPHTSNKIISKRLIKEYNFNNISSTISDSKKDGERAKITIEKDARVVDRTADITKNDDGETAIEVDESNAKVQPLIDLLVKNVLRLWKNHIIDFGYSPEDLIHVNGPYAKLLIPMPLFKGGFVALRLIEIVYIKELWPYSHKRIFTELAKLEIKVQPYLVDCVTTIVTANSIHGKHPPYRSKKKWILYYSIREDTTHQILTGLANSIEAHTKKIEKNAKFITESHQHLINLNYQFVEKLRIEAGEKPKVKDEKAFALSFIRKLMLLGEDYNTAVVHYSYLLGLPKEELIKEAQLGLPSYNTKKHGKPG